MVNVCSGGTGVRKPGQPSLIVLGIDVILTLLTRGAPFLVQAAAAALPMDLELDDFCNEDVPPFPSWSPAEIVALMTPGSAQIVAQAREKLVQSIRHLAWYDLCQCSSGSPTVLPIPPAPVGAPVEASPPCWVAGTTMSVEVSNDPNQCNPDGFRLDLFPPGPTTLITWDSTACPPQQFLAVARDPAWSSWTLSAEIVEGSGSVSIAVATVTDTSAIAPFQITTGGQLNTFSDSARRNTWSLDLTPFPYSAAPYAVAWLYGGTSSTPSRVSASLSITCGGNSSGNDCCPPDPAILNRLALLGAQISDIHALLSATSVLTEIGQVAITGEGEITLALGTRAISVDLLELGPEAYTSALGRPRGLMRVGSIRWGDGIGYSPRRFIDGDRFTDIRPAGALTVSYQLLEGTSGTLRFLG